MMTKKDKKAGCPFRNLKPCDESCALYRKGIRFKEVGGEAFPFESCALNIIADNLEQMHTRTHMMQSEVGDMKNTLMLKTAVDLGLASPERQAELSRRIQEPLKIEE